MTRAASPPGMPARQRALEDWRLCQAAPGQHDGPDDVDACAQADWVCGPLGTVAAMLARAGRWHLDEPTTRLDAHDWWLRAQVTLEAADLGAGGIGPLRMGGLGGLVDMWVNGRHALRSDNMHLSHELDWRLMLRPGLNTVHLRVASLDAALQARRPRPRWRTPMVEHQQLRWFRQTLLGRTPGWSPAAPPLGAWRDIGFDAAAPEMIQVESLAVTMAGPDRGRVQITCRSAHALDELVFEVARDERLHRAALQPDPAEPGRWRGTVDVPQPALWWPHTHGEPVLHEVRLHVRRRGAAGATVQPLRSIGFRTIEVDTDGGDFALRVNGVPVFCRGACWMPLDPLDHRPAAGACDAALAQVRDAGMNMLRISGTTVYESDAFHDACDAHGVLVWQDLMFASMDYPADDAAFAASVGAEVDQQLARWQAHPCVAVVCGNSEGGQQAAMWGAPRDLWVPPLFHEVIAARAKALLPGVPYWPSSAHGGALPHQSDEGTSSYYGVGAYLRPPHDARRAEVRFATECLAFANVPQDATLHRMPQGASIRVHHPAWKARVPRDLGAGWDFEDVRDHYLAELFGVDPMRCRYADHDRYLALSREVSGELMAGAFAEWRRPGSPTRGALVWTLRDFRAGAGWGLLDEAGAPKACWYPLRRTLQPTAVLLTDEGGNGLAAHVVHEPDHSLDAVLKVALFAPGDALVARASQALQVAPRGARTVALAGLFDGFHDLTYSYRFGPPAIALVQVRLESAGGALLGEAWHFPAGLPSSVGGQAPLAAAALQSCDDGSLVVRMQAQGFAQSVSIDLDGHDLSDNHFHMAPGDVREVRVRPRSAVNGARGVRGSVRMLNAAQVLTLKAPA
jgi:beta-mannosidase